MKDVKRNPPTESLKSNRSIASLLEPLVSRMEDMTMHDIKLEFNRIIDDPNTNASPELRNKLKRECRDVMVKSKIIFILNNLTFSE